MDDVLPDLLAPGLKLVFCGNAAGKVSARRGAPFVGPGNYFWPVVHEVGLTPVLLAPAVTPGGSTRPEAGSEAAAF